MHWPWVIFQLPFSMNCSMNLRFHTRVNHRCCNLGKKVPKDNESFTHERRTTGDNYGTTVPDKDEVHYPGYQGKQIPAYFTHFTLFFLTETLFHSTKTERIWYIRPAHSNDRVPSCTRGSLLCVQQRHLAPANTCGRATTGKLICFQHTRHSF